MKIDWGMIGAIAGVVSVVIAGVELFKKKKNCSSNKQVIKGKKFEKNKIIQSNSESNCDENKQIIKGKKFIDNEIRQEK